MDIKIQVTGLEGLIAAIEKLTSMQQGVTHAQVQGTPIIPPQQPSADAMVPPSTMQPAYPNPVQQPVYTAQQPMQNAAPVYNPAPVYNQPAAPMTAPHAAVPTSAPTYTQEQLAVAATQLNDAGRRTELVQLLASFGVQALTALPKEQYGAFATRLREMGARI